MAKDVLKNYVLGPSHKGRLEITIESIEHDDLVRLQDLDFDDPNSEGYRLRYFLQEYPAMEAILRAAQSDDAVFLLSENQDDYDKAVVEAAKWEAGE